MPTTPTPKRTPPAVPAEKINPLKIDTMLASVIKARKEGASLSEITSNWDETQIRRFQAECNFIRFEIISMFTTILKEIYELENDHE